LSPSCGAAPRLHQAADDAEDLVDQHGSQAQRRLVEKHHLGLAHQRAANRQHLLLAARQVARQLVPSLPQSRKIRIDQLDALLHRAEVVLDVAAGDQVLLRGQMLEDPPSLEDLGEAEPRDVVGAQPVDALLAELD